MSKFLGLIKDIYAKDKSIEKMTRTNTILEQMFDDLQKTHKELYEKTMYKLEEIAYEITEEQAEEIVEHMKPYGEKWSYETIEEFLKTKGITENSIEYFIVTNMAINDYYDLAKTVGKQDDIDFYFTLAKDFITDEDAKDFKVAKYFLNDCNY